MKVALCVGWYFPDSVGGSEVYVQSLGRELAASGHEVVVFAPSADPRASAVERYEHAGLRVVRYPVPEERTPEQHAGVQPHARFLAFVEALLAERAYVFHQHSLTYGCNHHHIEAARGLGMRVLFTAHMPEVVCARGTMLRMGKTPCDGHVLRPQCVPCDAQSRGLPAPLAPLVAPLARIATRTPRSARIASSLPKRLRTMLALPDQIGDRASTLHQIFERAHHVVAVCEWLASALRLNGAPEAKLVVQRQGVDGVRAAPRVREPGAALRVAYFGRAHAVKGIDTLIAAVGALDASVALEAHLYVTASNADEQAVLARIAALARTDARVHLHAPLPPGEVAAAMQGYDVIAVPSRWLETGPLVALQAIALGVPVLGSDRGGLAEVVEPGATGWLEPAEDVARWSARLTRIARGQDPLDPSRARLRVPTAREVADAMIALYTPPSPRPL